MQTKGFAKAYVSNPEIRQSFVRLKFLAFLPLRDVVPAFVAIANASPATFKPMIAYFEKTYIGKRVRNRTDVRAKPLFDMQMWNVRERVLNEDGRTNNNIEAWHKVFEVGINWGLLKFGMKYFI